MQRLRSIGLGNVHVIDYPNACAQSTASADSRSRGRALLDLPVAARLLLCFGGTRHDKGVDLAIAALAATPSDVHLLVAGAAQDFDEKALNALARRYGVEDRLLLRLGHVPDDEVALLFCAADVVLLPYRPMFTGQSGPLAIAGSLGVPVIGADVPVLYETIVDHGLGKTFRAGSVDSLAMALCGTWPCIDPAAQRLFAVASDPMRFAAGNLAVYQQVLKSSSEDRRTLEVVR
jgi:glycosyltransferase involved in cell wall biosynthesis